LPTDRTLQICPRTSPRHERPPANAGPQRPIGSWSAPARLAALEISQGKPVARAGQRGSKDWSFSDRHCRMYGCCDGCGNDRRLLPGPFSTSSPGEFCPLGGTRNRSGNPGSRLGSTSVSGLPQFCYAEDEWNEPRLITFVESRKHRHKILAGAVNDPVFNSFREVAELPPHRLMMLCRCFQDYKMSKPSRSKSTRSSPRQGRC